MRAPVGAASASADAKLQGGGGGSVPVNATEGHRIHSIGAL